MSTTAIVALPPKKYLMASCLPIPSILNPLDLPNGVTLEDCFVGLMLVEERGAKLDQSVFVIKHRTELNACAVLRRSFVAWLLLERFGWCCPICLLSWYKTNLGDHCSSLSSTGSPLDELCSFTGGLTHCVVVKVTR